MHAWCRASTYLGSGLTYCGAVHLGVGRKLAEVLTANGLVRSTAPFAERVPLKGSNGWSRD